MCSINMDYIQEYIRSVLPKSSEILKTIEDYAKKNNVPIIHPEVAQFIRVIIQIKNPRRILEIGTAIGYSAIVMAEASKRDCEIITIERREDMVKLAKENFERADLNNRIRILHGEAQEILPSIKDKFDLIFLDAAKGKYMEFLPYCIENLNCGGVIISDNVLFKGMVANDDLVIRRKKTIVRRMREYLKYICNTSILETSIIPIGDGIALTIKKDGR
ncbi:O-methyltransferase [Caloranaerobacter ferrireducens]|uniref:O-methyltransferase n=1 Tax=Caloranaerobacter ferrireducens TaxID=1323370 RepID=UPI000AB4F37B|nr:O-methyltransferase [Caloranaerobacter ferrireducens]